MSPPQAQDNVLPTYTREEVARHKKYNDCWVVLHGQVYDVTKWLPKHPGGARILMHYAGEDATVSATNNMLGLSMRTVGGVLHDLQLAWTSFHNNKAMVRKYLACYHIGTISSEQQEV